jgi:hypothetical protein
MAFVISAPRIALGAVYALLFGVLIGLQLEIGTKVRSQRSNASVLQEKTPAFSDRVSFYDSFYDRCGITVIISCIAFLCFVLFSFKTTQVDFVTSMTQIAVLLGTFIFFFSIKILSFSSQSDNRYGTNMKSVAVTNLILTGVIVILSIGLVLRYGKIKEWNLFKRVLNPDWVGQIKTKLKGKSP